MSALGPVASFLWFLSLSVVAGGSALLLHPKSRALSLTPARRTLGTWFILAASVALATGVTLLFAKSIELADFAGTRGNMAAVWMLLGRSRFGHVWCVQQSATTLLLAPALLAGGDFACRRGCLCWLALCASIPLLVAPLASHSAGVAGTWSALAAHGLHLVTVAIWLGALLTLAIVLHGRDACRDPGLRRDVVDLVAAFSRLAPLFIALAIPSGIALGIFHVGSWPRLLGTRYGALLLGKIVLLIGGLAQAGSLRWRLLPAWRAGDGESTALAVRRRLTTELVTAAAIVLLAALLADTIPAAHDTVTWWLPFRFSIRATWSRPWVPERVSAGALVLVAASALAAGSIRRRAWGRVAAFVTAGALAAAATGLPPLAVPAYPGTYWTPEVSYHVASVTHGRELFREHCVRCHGTAGRGDGPLAPGLPKRPANLTEPHTADHTAGDMFWWLTYGISQSGMPPMADVLTPDDRWDLINYLRAFAAGYQGRLLNAQVSPGKPWLAAVDFNFTTASGARGILRDFRGREAVLLVLFTPGTSDERLNGLRELWPELAAHGATVIAVPETRDGASADRFAALAPLPVVTDESDEIAETYALLRRTFENPGNDLDDDRPPHWELLIDRFGYIRARWRPDSDPRGFDDRERLLAQIRLLAAEPEILPPPDEHVH